ncbi:trehalose-6-phosphate synthase [Herbiconiux sp. CPCC 205716]|uniref:Trehalose-6-phosphate synthase n=1 Tax=Herbiconiux gentiana TaxID=2970912 RepID=A0ABT2GAC8_9MICO|nr:trehalose-6-phosphate synthase [Herbiconiux gentiana]MCS5713152.1 trehalose-6-phosphate synthase [Herbiconiux gentiana]
MPVELTRQHDRASDGQRYQVVIAAFDGPAALVPASGGDPQFVPAKNALGPGMSAAALAAGTALWVFPPASTDDHEAAAVLAERTVDRIGSVTTDFALLNLDAEILAGHRRVLTATLWPLFSLAENEAAASVVTPSTADWSAFCAVNEAFARYVDDHAASGARVMVRELALLLVPGLLRRSRPDLSVAFFTFAPWGTSEALRRLPRWLDDVIVDALSAPADVGFLSSGSVRRFYDAMRDRCSGTVPRSAAYRLPIDSAEIAGKALAPATETLVDELARDSASLRIIARAERAERPANLLGGLAAYREMLSLYPQWRERVVHLNAVFPGGEDIAGGSVLAAAKHLADLINAEFGTSDWLPVDFASGVDYARSLALMRIADVFVATPTVESMSITTWEAIELNERSAAFVFSRTSGVAELFPHDAAVVDALDVTATARAMHEALLVPKDARQERLGRMRHGVRTWSPAEWFAAQLDGVAGAEADEGARAN